MLKRTIASLCILYMFGVHVPLLRLVGARCAILVSRALACVHWLLVVLGADAGGEKKALSKMQELFPGFWPGLSPRTALLRALRLKHRAFVEYSLASTARGRRYIERTYRFEGREYLDAAIKAGKGGIVLPFHFGVAFLLFPALKIFGYELLLHIGRATPYLQGTFAWAQRLAVHAAKAADRCNMPALYHYPNYVFAVLVRRLRRGGLIGLNGDGMAGTDFLEVPFLGGTLRLPAGPARLSALAEGAPILPMFVLAEGLGSHRIVIHPPLRCLQNTPEAVRETVAAYTAILERYVRARPWDWLVWRQLMTGRHDDGRLRLEVRPALPREATAAYDAFRPGAPADAVQER